MPLGDFARRRSPCFRRSSMVLPLMPPCRDHSVTESVLSGCLSTTSIPAHRLRLQGDESQTGGMAIDPQGQPVGHRSLGRLPPHGPPCRSPSFGSHCVADIARGRTGEMLTHRPRWRRAVPLRLRPLRMTNLSAGECLVRLTGHADTPHSRLLRSLTSSSSSLQGIVQAGLPSVLASFVSFRSALRFAASSTVHHLRSGPSTDGVCGCASNLLRWYRARPPSSATESTMLTCVPRNACLQPRHTR